jgi:hypothetical protein
LGQFACVNSFMSGVDREGHLVYIDKVGAVDGSILYKNFTIDEIVHFHIQQMESITRLKDEISVKTGRRYYKQLVILDLKGLGMSHLSSKFTEPMKKFIKIDQEMYPETLFTMIIVNAGFIVKSAWALVSPWLDPITKQNIKFGEAELKNNMDPDQIPKYLGGTCRCEKCLITPFIAGESANKSANNNAALASAALQRASISKGNSAETSSNNINSNPASSTAAPTESTPTASTAQ